MVGDCPPDVAVVGELESDVAAVGELKSDVATGGKLESDLAAVGKSTTGIEVMLLLTVVKDVMKVDSVGEETDKAKVELENTLDVEEVILMACELTMCVESRRIIYSENDSNCEQTYSMVESVKTDRLILPW